MPSRRVCSALNCNFSKFKNPEIIFHRFPRNPEIRKKWIGAVCDEKFFAIDRERDLRRSSYRICSNHFHSTDYQICSNNKKNFGSSFQPTQHYCNYVKRNGAVCGLGLVMSST